MVDALITVVAVIAYVIIFAICSYVLIYFAHEDDNQDAYFPKLVVVLGLTTAITSIMMMPLDVANRGSKNGGIPMDALWITIYIVIAVLVVLVIPWAYFYYTAYDPEKKSKACGSAFCGLIVFLVIFAVVGVVTYFFFSVAEVPILLQTSVLVPGDRPVSAGECAECSFTSKNGIQLFQLSFVLYFIAVLALFGGFFFCVFGGIGMVVAPVDFFNTWRLRPKPINDVEFEYRKILIGQVCDTLIKNGVEYRRKNPRRSVYNNWRNEVYMLEEEWDKTVEAHKPNGIKILWYWANLVFCGFGALLTASWILHTFLYTLFGVDGFLNTWFTAMDGVWSFFGVIFFGLYALWLELCVIQGNFKFGFRIPILFAIHPMKATGTLMNSFLFNVGLICLSSVGVTQFCATSFSLYARSTRISVIFTTSIQNLRILKWFWLVYVWIFLAFMVIAGIYLCVRPREKRVSTLARIKA
jgi:LMBR1 domain-containing protein 1